MTLNEYSRYEKEVEKIRKNNEKYFSIFKEDLQNAGLTDKTIKRHLSNVEFYLNDYCQRYEPVTMENCAEMINGFLGGYFIEKCMWSTPETIKTTAASIKKFFKYMTAHSFVPEEKYKDLCFTIKECMDEWQEQCRLFNDPDFNYFEEFYF